MRTIRKLVHKARTFHPMAKMAAKLGVCLMLFYLIIGLGCRLGAPSSGSYFYLMNLYRGCLEAASASLAVGVCAAVIGDLILSRHSGKQDGQDDD